jgi:hypothetical protein
MCLSFPEKDDTVEQGLRNFVHNDKITCENICVDVHILPDGRKIVTYLIPVKGARSVFYPVPYIFTKYIKRCRSGFCLMKYIMAITKPYQIVPYSEQLSSFYRSFLDECESEPVEIDPLIILVNPDGGIIAIVPIAKYINERHISQEQRIRLGPEMLKCIKKGLEKIGKTIKDLFITDDGMSDLELLSFLFDAVTPGCDIIICIMPPDKTEGTFTIYFSIPAEIDKIPFLGLTHGDMTSQQEVLFTYYVFTNIPNLKFIFPADEPYEDEDKEEDISFKVNPPEAFTCDYFLEGQELEEYILHADIDPDRIIHTGPRGKDSHGNKKWKKNQIKFQEKPIEGYKDTVSKIIRDTESCEATWDEYIYGVELKVSVGKVPRNTTYAYIAK